MVTQISYVGLFVSDIAAATAFYRDQLGLEVNADESIPGRYTQFVLDGGATLGILARAESQAGQAYEPGVLVDDVDGTYAVWLERGVELLGEPQDLPFGRTFLFRTPDGHVMRAFRPHSQ
jgi:predicted enzyme related to lactoylglutathione lyase